MKFMIAHRYRHACIEKDNEGHIQVVQYTKKKHGLIRGYHHSSEKIISNVHARKEMGD